MFLAHKGKLFRPLIKLRKKEDWAAMEVELVRLESHLLSMPEDSSKNYYFNYYFLKSASDSALHGNKMWAQSLNKAIQ